MIGDMSRRWVWWGAHAYQQNHWKDDADRWEHVGGGKCLLWQGIGDLEPVSGFGSHPVRTARLRLGLHTTGTLHITETYSWFSRWGFTGRVGSTSLWDPTEHGLWCGCAG